MNARRAAGRAGTMLLAALAALAAAAAGATEPAQVPEPPSFWTGPPSAPTPSTLHGGRLIHVKALSALLRRGGVIVVDVSNEEKRPAGLDPNVLWSVPPHAAIPGSHWLPGFGLGEMSPSRDDFFRRELRQLTGGQLGHPLVIYCHQSCWLSWNAAKRAIGYGFRRVYWFPEGIDGWRRAGLPTNVVTPTRE